jgi:hypothetical protein
MSLLASELQRIRFELGFPVLETGAEPYIGIAAIFDRVIQPYLSAGAVTTSSTSGAATSAATLRTINLADATGVSASCTLVVDVDDAQERGTVASVSGNAVTLPLSKAHTGTYPVTVEGGESIVRDILRKLRLIEQRQEEAMDGAGIKKADEVEFFGNTASGGSTVFSDLARQREHWRGELSRVLGIRGLTGSRGGGSTLEVY